MHKKAHRTWHERLDPFAELYAEMNDAITDRLNEMTTDDLQQLVNDAEEPDQGNCWCYTYAVAPIVRGEARLTLRLRENLAATEQVSPKIEQGETAEEARPSD